MMKIVHRRSCHSTDAVDDRLIRSVCPSSVQDFLM
jgi:hypothetical protein